MRKVYVARNSENTIDTKICPIIFVPGVMGTRLRLPNGSYKWDPDSAKEMIRLQWADGKTKRNIFDSDADAVVIDDEDIYIEEGTSFKFNPVAGITQYFTIEERRKAREISLKQGFVSLVGDFYRNFLLKTHEKFKDYGMPVYAVGYDWRQSNKKSGQGTLTPAINKILETEQAENCVIITHSMGGLVARAAIKQSKELEAKILGVIHVVQPVFGATVLYRRFFTGTIRRYDSTSVKPMARIADKVLFDILGGTPHEFGENMSSLQGPLELLPTNSYNHNQNNSEGWLRWEVNSWETFDGSEPSKFTSRHKDTDFSDVYKEYAQKVKSEISAAGLHNFHGYDFPVREKIMQKLTVASAFHQLLGSNRRNGKEVFKHPNTYAIAGTGLKTDVATEFDLKFESVRDAVVYGEYRLSREERYQPLLEKINRYSYVPMLERRKFVEDILLLIGDADFARLTKPSKLLEGDGTVPHYSAWGLFPDEAGENKITTATFNPHIHRQLTVSGVEHGAAYNSEAVVSAVHRLIKHINMFDLKDVLEKEKSQEEEEKRKREEERKKNWGKGGWRKDV